MCFSTRQGSGRPLSIWAIRASLARDAFSVPGNASIFTWLQPYEEKTFTQYFMPYRELGVVKNATADLLMNIEPEGNAARLKLFATSEQRNLHISISRNGEILWDEVRDVTPENLLDEALRYAGEGELLLKVGIDDGFARFDFIDRRRSFTQEELNLLFYPDNAKVGVSDNGDVLYGTEYLICKQIIRDHDEFGGRRGCRINANVADDGVGFSVWFTLPLKTVI